MRDREWGRILSFKPLVWLGTVSYFVYVFHSAIFHMLPIRSPSEKAAVGVALILLIATVSWNFIERPILKTKSWEPARLR